MQPRTSHMRAKAKTWCQSTPRHSTCCGETTSAGASKAASIERTGKESPADMNLARKTQTKVLKLETELPILAVGSHALHVSAHQKEAWGC